MLHLQEVVLDMSDMSSVYTGTVGTLPEVFWKISSSDSPPKAERLVKWNDGVLGPLREDSTVNITYKDAWPPSVSSVLRVAVSAGTFQFVPSAFLCASISANQSVGLVLRRESWRSPLTSPPDSQTVAVRVRSRSPADSRMLALNVIDTETLLLRENVAGTGEFSGYFRMAATHTQTFSDAPGVLMTNMSILEAWYPDPEALSEPSWAFRHVRMATDASKESPRVQSASPGAGERLTITVVDPDADVRFGDADVVTVKVTSSKLFEGPERVLLTETLAFSSNVSSGGVQGVFTGVLETKWATAVSASGDGVLHVQQDDTLVFEYEEATDAKGASGIVRRSQVVLSAPGLAAVLTLAPHVLLENESLCVSLEDDLSIVSLPEVLLQWQTPDGRLRQATVILANESSPLAPAAPSTSFQRYRQCLQTSTTANTANTDQIALWEMPRGTIINATYADSLPFATASDFAAVSRKGILEVSPLVVGMDRTMSITVTDADLNQNSSKVESGTVSVRSSWAEEGLESVRLYENAADSQVFTGIIRTVFNFNPSPASCEPERGCSEALSEPATPQPLLHVREGDLLLVTYQDVSTNTGRHEAGNDVSVNARVGVTGKTFINKCDKFQGSNGPTTCEGVLVGGDALSLTVVDADIGFEMGGGGGLSPPTVSKWFSWVNMNNQIPGNGNSATVRVVVTTSKDAEKETVVLRGAQASEPGTFTGLLDTCMGSEHCVPRAGVFTSAACLACRSPTAYVDVC